MPYLIQKSTDGQFCVHKKNEDGSAGENVGCSDTEEQAHAHIAAMYANETKTEDRPQYVGEAIKALGEGKIGGYLVVYGDEQHTDTYKEWFTPHTDYSLDWYPTRPVLYHHGLNQQIKSEDIGRIISITPDTKGLYAIAQLDMSNPYAVAVYKMVLEGKLGWSSGSIPHLVEVADTGEIKKWAIVEGSLTPSPAEPHRTTVQAIRSALTELTPAPNAGTEEQDANREPTVAEPHPERALSIRSQYQAAVKHRLPGVKTMGNTNLIAALEKQGIEPAKILEVIKEMETLGEPDGDEGSGGDTGMMAANDDAMTPETPPTPPAYGKSETGSIASPDAVKNIIRDAFKADRAAEKAEELRKRTAPAVKTDTAFTGQNPMAPANQVQVFSKYRDMSGEDMSFMANGMRGIAAKTGGYAADPLPYTFYKEMLAKASADVASGKLDMSVQRANQLMAIKSNELDNTTAATAAGNWVPELWSSNLWKRIRVDNMIASQFQVVEMPSEVYDLPVESTDPTVYKVPETTDATQLSLVSGTAIPSSLVSAAKVQLTATKLALRVGFSAEQEEDSIIPFIPQLREQAMRTMQNAIDNVLINGDTAAGATTNINAIDATPASTDKYLAFNGLRKLPLVTNTALTLASGGLVTLQQIRQLRFLLRSATNVYANRPEDLCIFVDVPTYGKLLNIDELLVYMTNGRGSTVNDGTVPTIDGSPVYASAEMSLSLATGKVNATTTASNVYGNLVIAAKPAWYVGYRRQITQALEYLSYYDSYQLTMTLRLAFINKDTVASAELTGITV